MQDTKSNIQKYVTFLYTNNKLSEREIKKLIPFTMASKKTKYLRINLMKEVKDTENYTTLMEEVKEDTDTQKEDIPCLWV